MDKFESLKAQKDAILRTACGEDRFAAAVRAMARLREQGLIRVEGETEKEVQDNLYKSQILIMQVFNAATPRG